MDRAPPHATVLSLDQHAAASMQAYLEYRLIVGDDDGGKLMTPDEFEV
jgi:hypothetical protein